jgi:hypothetical protein
MSAAKKAGSAVAAARFPETPTAAGLFLDTHPPLNPYDVLGVAPTSEDVVIRAAWRALMRKYLAAEHGDPLHSDRRAGEVNAAYELLADPSRRLAYDKAHRAPRAPQAAASPPSVPPPASAWPALLAPESRLALGSLAVVLACVAGAGLVLGLRHAARAPAAPRQGLKIHKPAPRPAALLPCYVDGRPAGNLPLAACAARNGVATGPLETGIEPTAAKDRGPGLVVVPPRPTGPTPAAPVPAGQGGAAGAMALARAFYGALGGGDGYAAAAMIDPEKRGSGALSGARMSRFYASLREPLRLTSMYPLAPDTVFVRYRFTTRRGAVCLGAANVITATRGGHLFIRAIRARNGC